MINTLSNRLSNGKKRGKYESIIHPFPGVNPSTKMLCPISVPALRNRVRPSLIFLTVLECKDEVYREIRQVAHHVDLMNQIFLTDSAYLLQ